MNKKNLLLTLALPVMILCACGNGEKKDFSSQSESSTSEASSEATVNYEVDAETWGSSFDSVLNYTAISSVKNQGAIITTITRLTPSLVEVSEFNQEGEDAASKLISDIYSSKNSDGTYDEYAYVASEDLYAVSSKKKSSSYWQFSSTLFAMFKNGYSSFSYEAEKKGYFASSLACDGSEGAYSAKDVTIHFSNGRLVDIDFDACGDDGVTILSHGLIHEIGSTSVSLPDPSKVKSGLLASKEDWTEAWIKAADGKNATYKGTSSDSGAYFLTLFTDEAIRKTVLAIEDDKETSSDIYYSTEGESNYVYTKDSSGKYAKKEDSSMEGRYEELTVLMGFFESGHSLFSYDKEGDSYKAAQIDDPMNPGKAYTNAAASFSNGKLSSLTYAYDGMECSIDSVGTTVVNLPASDSVYPEGEVGESVWKNAFASASSDFNFSYSANYAYSSEYYSYSTDEKYVFSGDAAEYNYLQSYEGCDPSSDHFYYSLENGECYQYSSSDDEYTWSKEKSTTDVFADAEKKLNLFADSFSSFSLDELSGSYKADSIALDGTAYTDIVIAFSDSKLNGIEYKSEGTTYAFGDFGNSRVALPTIA